MKRLFVGTVPNKKKGEEVIVGNSPTKKWSEVIGSYTPAKKIVKRLLVGTVPPTK